MYNAEVPGVFDVMGKEYKREYGRGCDFGMSDDVTAASISSYNEGVNDSIKIIKSISDYNTNTQRGEALRNAVGVLRNLKKSKLKTACPICGSTHYIREGEYYQCTECMKMF